MARPENAVASSLATSARLRSAVEDLDREEVLVRNRRGPVGKWLARISRLLTLAVVGVLLVDAWVAYDTFRTKEPPIIEGTSPAWSDLEVWDEAGVFGGQVEVSNPTDVYVEMLVTVDLFEGDQNVGDMQGSITLKPGSASVVDLEGFDPFVAYDDTHVHLLGIPG